jgi:hypothetical protein
VGVIGSDVRMNIAGRYARRPAADRNHQPAVQFGDPGSLVDRQLERLLDAVELTDRTRVDLAAERDRSHLDRLGHEPAYGGGCFGAVHAVRPVRRQTAGIPAQQDDLDAADGRVVGVPAPREPVAARCHGSQQRIASEQARS